MNLKHIAVSGGACFEESIHETRDMRGMMDWRCYWTSLAKTSDARLRRSSINFFRSSDGRKKVRGRVWPLQDCDYEHRRTPMATHNMGILREMSSAEVDERVNVFLGGDLETSWVNFEAYIEEH